LNARALCRFWAGFVQTFPSYELPGLRGHVNGFILHLNKVSLKPAAAQSGIRGRRQNLGYDDTHRPEADFRRQRQLIFVEPQANPVTLRPLTEEDLPMLHGWLNRPHISEWWGGEEECPTLDDVREHYLPEVLAAESVTAYIAMFEGRPIGYAQSYIALGSGGGWWEDETDPGVRGIDQSLADPAQLNRGLGTLLVRALVAKLFSDPAVSKIQTDPAPDNHRAIRCYEKAGFAKQGIVQTPDGPALYMVQSRESLE